MLSEFSTFCQDAAKLTDSLTQGSIAAFDPRPLERGRWHPNGFAIFDLLYEPAVGTVRLHIWPKSERQLRKAHPRIHNHGFHLYSTVLAGIYREVCFTIVEPLPEDREETQRPIGFNEFLVRSSGRTNHDSVEASGDRLRIQATSLVKAYGYGSFHALELGVFHATLIPKGAFCATLAVMGHRSPDFVDQLLGRCDLLTTNYDRVQISVESAEHFFNEMRQQQLVDQRCRRDTVN